MGRRVDLVTGARHEWAEEYGVATRGGSVTLRLGANMLDRDVYLLRC